MINNAMRNISVLRTESINFCIFSAYEVRLWPMTV